MNYSSCIIIFDIEGLTPENHLSQRAQFDHLAGLCMAQFNRFHTNEVRAMPVRWLQKSNRLANAFRASAKQGSPVDPTLQAVEYFGEIFKEQTDQKILWKPFMILDGFGMGLDILAQRKIETPQIQICTYTPNEAA